MKKESSVIIFVLILCISISSLIVYQIYDNKQKQIDSINKILLQEAKAHFNNIVITREWSSQFGGVFVKNENLEPNPYLIDNHTFTHTKEKLIKINPAWMTRQISEISNKRSNYYFKITSLNPINPINKADEFEKKGLENFEGDKTQSFYYEKDDKSNTFNLIGSLVVKNSCLQCHANQGYKEGDIRGGIRVTIPIQEHNNKIYDIERNATFLIIALLLISLIIVTFIIRFIKIIFGKQREIESLNKNLEKRVKEQVEKNKKHEELIFQQSKMSALGEMMSNIAHQWRQPLSAITTATSGMQIQKEMKMLRDEDFDSATKHILEQSNYLSTTIEDFSKFFQKDGKIETFTLYEFFKLEAGIFRGYFIDEKITLNIDNIDEENKVSGYMYLLTQVILKIFDNSKDQFKKNDYEGYIHITSKVEEGFILLSIYDNAGGIPDEIIDRIFEPYFTTKHQSQGTGIGLYMSAHTIDRHLNGTLNVINTEIEFNNRMYKGACFNIKLPIVK